MAPKKPIGEPLVGVVVDGILHQVPESRAALEREIATGAALKTDFDRLQATHDARGADLQALISSHQAEITRLTGELEKERAPLKAVLDGKQQQLDQATSRIATAALPIMGEQKSMKYVGIAGAVQIERSPKMKVDSKFIPNLQKLLAGDFNLYFEVEQKIKPLKKAWELLTVLTGRRKSAFAQMAEIEDIPRARFVVEG